MCTLWEALKTYICGGDYVSKALATQVWTEHHKTLTDSRTLIPGLYIVYLQSEFNLLTTSETTNLMTQANQRFYKHGEKAGKFLAH